VTHVTVVDAVGAETMSTTGVRAEIEALRHMTVGQLKVKYREALAKIAAPTAQAQLRRQLQRRAAHFRLQQHKYAKEHTADSLRRSISFALRAELSHALSAASN
jgi:hypothetical protein